MSESPAVSVVLPVFNGGPLLRRAVQSILTQSFQQFELILIDDASADQTADICAGFAECDPRVRYVRHEQNLGVAATLNEGLQLSRAPYVARMDADDEALPERLRVQVEFMDSQPRVSVAGSFVYHMGSRPRFDHLIELPTSVEEVHRTLPKYNCIYHPSTVLRRSVINALGGYRVEFVNAEDYDLWLRVSRTGAICNIREPLLRYRFSPGGATLGRKWQQLYYVYLAQVANSTALTLDEARLRADQLLRETNRRQFFSDVANGTVAELLTLRLWRDAASVLVAYESELDPATFTGLAREVLQASVTELPRGPAEQTNTPVGLSPT